MARFRPFTLAVAVAFVLRSRRRHRDGGRRRRTGEPGDAALATTQLPRGIRPLHYDVALVPNAATLTFDGRATVTIDVSRADLAHHAQRRRSRLLVGSPRCRRRAVDRRRGGDDRRRRRRPDRDLHLRHADSRPAATPGDRLHRQDRHAGDGPVRASTTTRRAAASARSSPSSRTPTRAASSRPGTSRRTRRPSRSRRPCRPAQMAVSNMPVAATEAGRRTACSRVTLRHHAEDVDLPAVLRRRRLRARHRAKAGDRGRRRHPPRRHRPGAVRARRLAAPSCATTTTTSACPIRCPSSTTSPRPGSSQFFGAMENWGAIFTFEYVLLRRSGDLDPGRPPARLRDRRARDGAPVVRRPRHHALVGRPLAQRGLRLLDGRRARPPSCIRNGTAALDAVAGATSAMARDAFAATHPVVQHVETVDQASQAFDAITYSKGEAVIRMLESLRRRRRLARRACAPTSRRTPTATPSPTTSGARSSAAAGRPITDIAHDFTLQPGVPLIRVERGGLQRRRDDAAR